MTTEITKNDDAKGFDECKTASKRGGGVAGKARLDAEEELGRPIVSEDNYLTVPEKKNRKMLR